MLTDGERQILQGLVRELQEQVDGMRFSEPLSRQKESQLRVLDICFDLGALAEISKKRMTRWGQ